MSEKQSRSHRSDSRGEGRHHRDSHRDSRRHRHHRSSHSSRHNRSTSKDGSEPKKRKVEESTEDGDWVVAEDTGNFYSNGVQSAAETPEVEHIQSVSPDDGEVSDITEPNQPPPSTIASVTLPTINDLNKLRASILKAELQGNTDKVEDLKREYDELSKRVLPKNDGRDKESGLRRTLIDSRFEGVPKRGETETETDPTIQDMLREELSTRNERLDVKMAEQISRDGGYVNDLDYIADNAEKLAEMTKKSDKNKKNQMIENTRKLHESISDCQLCLEEGGSSGTTIIAIATQVYLCVAPEPAIVNGTLAIVPMDHYTNTLECNDDEWEEIRNFMKCITQMWHKQRKGVLFYENAVNRSGRMHASIFAVPVPFHLLESAPAFFQEAIISSDDEWSTHRHIIDTRKASEATRDVDAKYLFRTSIAKAAPYFHVWFNINGGIGHIVENTSKWPKGDRFAREVIGGMLRVDVADIRKSTRWVKDDKNRDYIDNLWRDFDWTTDIPR